MPVTTTRGNIDASFYCWCLSILPPHAHTLFQTHHAPQQSPVQYLLLAKEQKKPAITQAQPERSIRDWHLK
jgi:hypothetical protein